jgi:nucleotide-binding universal stress UspA family protein
MDTLKSILLHVDASPHTVQRMRLASQIAQAHGATVTALYATLPVSIEYASTLALGAEVAPLMLEYEAERLVRAKAQFDKFASVMTPCPNWMESSGEPVSCVARRALCADLVIVGQHDPNSGFGGDLPVDFVEAVVMASGRPVLVVPHHPMTDAVPGRVVLVAWKDTREAARAVTAALPLLTRATRVHVASWADGDPIEGKEAADIDGWLRSHGVSPVMHRSADRPHDVGGAALSLAQGLGADLMVMGCYGHSRAREWMLGGATRTVLKSMTRPVLLAH